MGSELLMQAPLFLMTIFYVVFFIYLVYINVRD